LPRDLAADEATKKKLVALERRYSLVEKAPRAHPLIGCFWTLYDHGPDVVMSWPADKVVELPEEARRAREKQGRKVEREARRARRDGGVLPVAASALKPTITPTTTKPSNTFPPTVYLFPGQGSQQVGKMLSREAAKRLPAVGAMLASAEKILGFDLLALVEEGGALSSQLDDTRYAQPALFVAGLAAFEELKARGGGGAAAAAAGAADGNGASASAPPQPTALAGLSLGEYCALVAAGALSFEDGLRVVKARGEAMASSSSGGRPHGMLSVVGLSDAKLGTLVSEARAEAEAERVAAAKHENNKNDADDQTTVLEVANFLFPEGRVVSGHSDALVILHKKAEAAGALKVAPLKVAGAFHTRLMRPAAEALRAALDAAELKPLLSSSPLVISNVTADYFPKNDVAAVKELLCRQLVEPVRWEEGLRKALELGGGEGGVSSSPVVRLYELGPNAQLKAMVRRMDTAAWKAMANVAAV
jgi:[acyl-carrier-protein] S-malonyltransferase